MAKQYSVYILTNFHNTVLYTGVSGNLLERVRQHREGLVDGFTKKYHLNKLVYYEVSDSIQSALVREKLIKGGSRARKRELIQSMNPEWQDLYLQLIDDA